MLISRQEHWSGLPFPSPMDHTLSDLSIMTLPTWEAPQGLASFHWVRQGCSSSVIRLIRFLWFWFQCVCPLMPSCDTYHLTWVSLTLDLGYLFTAAPAKRIHCSYLGLGVSPQCHHSWPWTWTSSSSPSCAHAASTRWTCGISPDYSLEGLTLKLHLAVQGTLKSLLQYHTSKASILRCSAFFTV